MAHNYHHIYKSFTAKPNSSGQNQKSSRQNKIAHGKTKKLAAKPKNFTAKQKNILNNFFYYFFLLCLCPNSTSTVSPWTYKHQSHKYERNKKARTLRLSSSRISRELTENQMRLTAAGACLSKVSVITGHEKLFYASRNYIYDQKL